MFGKNSGIHCLYFAVAIALASITVPAIAMTAYSITYQEYIEEGGKQFWQIRVTCTDLETKRFIVRSQNKAPWCAKQLPNFCANDKVQTAVNICSPGYELAMESIDVKKEKSQQNLVAQLNQQRTNKSELLEEQATIQSQRVELAQRKLDLRRREIDLQKRELDMNNRMENLP